MDSKLYSKILEETVNSNHKNLTIDYLEWRQWSVSWQITRNNMVVIDNPTPGKIYQWVTYNVISDALSTMKSIIIWETEDDYEAISVNEDKTKFIKNTNFVNTYVKIIEQLLIHWKVSVLLAKKDNKLDFEIINWDEYCMVNWKQYIVKKIKWNNIFSNNYFIKEIYQNESWIYIVNEYNNKDLYSTTEYDVYPIYTFKNHKYITKEMINQQDIINTKYTIEKNVELYNSDPLLVITWWQPEKWQKIRLWSWAALTISSSEAAVNRINWVSLQDNFVELKQKALLDFYKLAKISAIKNSELSWITSWYAIQLKMIETFAYVYEFRNILKTQLLEMFNYFYNLTQLSDLNITSIYFAPLIWEKNKEIENQKLKYELVDKKIDLINKLVKDLNYSKQEAEDFILKYTY